MREALEAETHAKRVKIASAIGPLPHFASQLAELVDPKPKVENFFGGYQLGQLGLQQADQRLFTQGGGVGKDTAAW
jgi:hypothetical protein